MLSNLFGQTPSSSITGEEENILLILFPYIMHNIANQRNQEFPIGSSRKYLAGQRESIILLNRLPSQYDLAETGMSAHVLMPVAFKIHNFKHLEEQWADYPGKR